METKATVGITSFNGLRLRTRQTHSFLSWSGEVFLEGEEAFLAREEVFLGWEEAFLGWAEGAFGEEATAGDQAFDCYRGATMGISCQMPELEMKMKSIMIVLIM
jgi:hypothetical protein